MKKKIIYDGKYVHLDVYSLTIGGRKVKREIVEHPDGAAILAFDEKGKIILVRQPRFPRGYVLELPEHWKKVKRQESVRFVKLRRKQATRQRK